MQMSFFGAAGLVAAGLAGALALAAAGGPATAHPGEVQSAVAERHAARAEAAGDRLGAAIERAIRGDGPFFTAEERAVIERACGYAPGSWDGYESNMHGRTFVCSNGRRVDSAEVRRVMEVAGPRIAARVSAAMSGAEVRAAMEEVTREATAAATAAIDQAEIARQAARVAEEATREALADAERAIAEASREMEAANREARRERRR